MERKSVLITGAAGYLGQQLLTKLREHLTSFEQVVATDVKSFPKEGQTPGIIYEKLDVRDPHIKQLLEKYQINLVVHLASIVTPGKSRDLDFEYAVDVKGSKNILQTCVEQEVKKIIVTSSGAAYGYYPDHPYWLEENYPLEDTKSFSYAHHKYLVEKMLEEYRHSHPELQQLVLRPGTILGPAANNQITNLFHKRFVLGIRGSDSPFVFISDQDVVECLLQGMLTDVTGIYNLAGDGVVTMREIARKLGKPYLSLPPILLRSTLFILYKLRLSQYPPEAINFLRYRPVLSNNKLKSQFPYQPKWTSEQVFDHYIATQRSCSHA